MTPSRRAFLARGATLAAAGAAARAIDDEPETPDSGGGARSGIETRKIEATIKPRKNVYDPEVIDTLETVAPMVCPEAADVVEFRFGEGDQ